MTLIMKMTVIFLLCANLVMATESFGQEKYSFSLNRVTLEEALNQILQNSGYYIVYTVKQIPPENTISEVLYEIAKTT